MQGSNNKLRKIPKKAKKNPIDKLIDTPTIDSENTPIIIEVTKIRALIDPVKNKILTWFLAWNIDPVVDTVNWHQTVNERIEKGTTAAPHW